MPALTSDQMLAALRREGLTVREYPGWRELCRCHILPGSGEASLRAHLRGRRRDNGWDPDGVMVHITAGGLGNRSVESYIRDIIINDPVTPAKCQFVVAPDGVVWLTAVGRCNHAGGVSPAGMATARAGGMSLTGYDDRRGTGTDGNTRYYGIENIAVKSMTAAQRDSSVRICAAVHREMKTNPRNSVGHGELSDQRSYTDPNLDMGAFRRDVIARFQSGPEENDDMALTPDEITRIAAAVWGQILPQVDLGAGAVGPATAGIYVAHTRALLGARDDEIVKLLAQIRDGNAKAIADAIPDGLAREVVDALADRLTVPAPPAAGS